MATCSAVAAPCDSTVDDISPRAPAAATSFNIA
jgi:hypothetical protein